ncbi:unnamed protein product, partial [Onchocerca ochengi]|uniref:Uncharacterized protein n=1 Tax=Onchocerca ochengi TaxID=42157 RepID=A0A182EWR9_ONCOC
MLVSAEEGEKKLIDGGGVPNKPLRGHFRCAAVAVAVADDGNDDDDDDSDGDGIGIIDL